MKGIDDEYISYSFNDNLYPSYNSAYFAAGKNAKKVYYHFVPSGQNFRNVGDFREHVKSYFRKKYNCDYVSPHDYKRYTQMNLFNN